MPEKSRRIEQLREMLEKFALLSEDRQAKENGYAEGVKDTLAAVRLFTKL